MMSSLLLDGKQRRRRVLKITVILIHTVTAGNVKDA